MSLRVLLEQNLMGKDLRPSTKDANFQPQLSFSLVSSRSICFTSVLVFSHESASPSLSLLLLVSSEKILCFFLFSYTFLLSFFFRLGILANEWEFLSSYLSVSWKIASQLFYFIGFSPFSYRLNYFTLIAPAQFSPIIRFAGKT